MEKVKHHDTHKNKYASPAALPTPVGSGFFAKQGSYDPLPSGSLSAEQLFQDDCVRLLSLRLL